MTCVAWSPARLDSRNSIISFCLLKTYNLGLKTILSLRRIADEHYIRVGMATQQAQFSSVRRPAEAHYLFRVKCGDGPAVRSAERLHPNVIDSPLADGGGHRRSVGRGGSPTRPGW